jgi:hypothetical protein
MANVGRKLSTGDILIFDSKNKDMFLIDAQNAHKWEADKLQSLESARQLAKEGVARHLDRKALESLQAAFAHIVVLA